MELCDDNLDNVINNKKAPYFGRATQIFDEQGQLIKRKPISLNEYHVSWQILVELTEGLQYLHSQSIMHRDLKPENVLVKYANDSKHIKLCDFGWSKEHENSSHTSNAGTKKYRAPEVDNNRKYNLTLDIYSASIIALELFGFSVDMTNEKK